MWAPICPPSPLNDRLELSSALHDKRLELLLREAAENILRLEVGVDDGHLIV